MRRWHVLKGNKGCETAQNCIYFDTETKPRIMPDGSERDRLWFGWMCAKSRTSAGTWGTERWVRFTTKKGFWDAIDTFARPRTRWYLFCHNTSYDLPIINLFNEAPKRGWVLQQAVIEAPPTIVTFRRDSVTLTFLDTLNWWRMPLAKLGEKVNLPKLKMPDKKAPKKDWDAYGKRDVEVLIATMEAWLTFLVEHDLGGFAVTLASQAFRTYRHRFMPHDIVIDPDEWSAKLSREGYHGGRVECFKLGRFEEPISAFDINSMYPAVMKGNLYPVKYLGGYTHQARERWEWLADTYCIMARCVVNARLPVYPLKTKAGLAFPTGEFETVLTTPEVKDAIVRGDLVSMSDVAVYEKAHIFDSFVDYFWNSRRHCEASGDGVGSWLFKIMSNSLYGKFGQSGQVYQTQENISDLRCMKHTIFDYDTGKLMKARQLGGLYQLMSQEGEARDSFPAIAAHVTAHARRLLWRLVEKAGLDNVLYCDTDSLFVTQAGAKRLKSEVKPTTLGKLKCIGTWPWVTIHGLKDYEYPGHTVRKGVRKDAIQLGPNTFQQTQWSSLKGLLGTGDMTAPSRKQVIKTLSREYKKPRKV